MSRLARLGEELAELQDRELAAMQRRETRPSIALGEHLLRRAGERRRRHQLSMAAAALLLVAIGSAGTLTLLYRKSDRTVASVRAEAGQRVTASALDVSMSFSDGSRVLLASGATIRTEMIGPSSASLDLERGRASLHVMHTKATRWTVHAGAYSVLVTGTRFHIEWKPEKGAFAIRVDEGSVRVSGGLINEPVDVSAGQSFAIEQGAASAVLPAKPSPAAAQRQVETVPEMPSMPSPPAAEPELPERSHRATVRRAASGAPGWRSEAEAGHYREAVTEAERRGFESICREASSADLLTLAEAARYANRSPRAEQALKAVRARFHSGEDGAMAAYLLGRIAAESRHDYADAAHWFRTYLSERPGGRLSREAEGRLLESLAFMDRSTAREAARTYLDHYPNGPHAAFARNLLGL